MRRKVHLSAVSLLVALIVASGVLASEVNAQPTTPREEVVNTAEEDVVHCVARARPVAHLAPTEEVVLTAGDVVRCVARAHVRVVAAHARPIW